MLSLDLGVALSPESILTTDLEFGRASCTIFNPYDDSGECANVVNFALRHIVGGEREG